MPSFYRTPQAVVPLGTSSIPVMYYLITAYFGLTSGRYAAFIGTATTSITLFNPLTTIYFMRCYREAVFPCLNRRIGQELATHVTGLDLATDWKQQAPSASQVTRAPAQDEHSALAAASCPSSRRL